VPLTFYTSLIILLNFPLYIPNSFSNLISLHFSNHFLLFSSPTGSISERMSYRGVPQDISLNHILFNVYLKSICQSLASLNHCLLLYTGDIALFCFNKSLDRSVDTLNDALHYLSIAFTSSFFTMSSGKNHFIINVIHVNRVKNLHPFFLIINLFNWT